MDTTTIITYYGIATWKQAFIEWNIGRREVLACFARLNTDAARNAVRKALSPCTIQFRDAHTRRALINAADAADTYRENDGEE